MNLLSMYALLGAYTPEGKEWLDELRRVLAGNVDFAVNFINEELTGVTVTKPEGTYMLFADCTEFCEKSGRTMDRILKDCWRAGVLVQDGRMFHGEHHLRMNLASPRSRIEEAMKRLKEEVFTGL